MQVAENVLRTRKTNVLPVDRATPGTCMRLIQITNHEWRISPQQFLVERKFWMTDLLGGCWVFLTLEYLSFDV